MRNTVVGITGKKAPITPSDVSNAPQQIYMGFLILIKYQRHVLQRRCVLLFFLNNSATNRPQLRIVIIETLLTIAYFFPIRIASNQLITEVANECLTVYAISPIENDNNNSYHLY